MSEAAESAESPSLDLFLSVPTQDTIKTRSYSDTSVFKISPRSTSAIIPRASDDQQMNLNAGDQKPKTRKFSRPRSPFSSDKALDFLTKITGRDLGKGGSCSPKPVRPTPRKAHGKGLPGDTVSKVCTLYDFPSFW